jgi:hypothetical protein
MEAELHLRRFWIGSLSGILFCLLCGPLDAANIRTQNFLIDAPTPQIARAVAESAERYRHDLAVHWLGEPLQPWPSPCPIRVIAGPNLAAQGVTTYNPRPVSDFRMEVVGTPQRILDSVLPHEITHTVLATHFGRPLPRWADEGICTTVEHSSERNKHEAKLREFLRSRRGIAMNRLFLLKDYPSDVLPMYAQGYSVCRFLIDQKGPRAFIGFLHDYMRRPSWTDNVKKHYDYDSLAELQERWLAWVEAGSGEVDRFAKTQPAVAPATAGLASQTIQASATTELALSSPSRATDRAASALGSASDLGSASAHLSASDLGRPNPNLGSGTALADASSDGWYQRKQREAQAKIRADLPAGKPADPMVPPSIRDSGRYRSTQPRPEQYYSRPAVPTAPASRLSGNPITPGLFR